MDLTSSGLADRAEHPYSAVDRSQPLTVVPGGPREVMDTSRRSVVGYESTVELPFVQPGDADAGTPVAEASPVPKPRRAVEHTGAHHAVPPLGTTAVLPYVGSHPSRRTRWVRAWMLTAPVDLIALLAPLLSTNYWRGTLFVAGLT